MAFDDQKLQSVGQGILGVEQPVPDTGAKVRPGTNRILPAWIDLQAGRRTHVD